MRPGRRIEAAGRLGDRRAVLVADPAVERGEARRQRREGVVVAPARGDLVDQPVEADRRGRAPAAARRVFRLSVTPTASISTKRVLASASGVTSRSLRRA